jgi:hypothetical protein
MHSTWLHGIIACLLILGLGAANAAPVPELLKPVDGSIAAKLNSSGNYGFRLQRFVAKRYRIVDVDFSLLDQPDAVFTITPFEDLQVTVRAVRDTAPPAGEQLRRWTGQLDFTGLGVYSVRADNTRVEVKSLPISLWVRSGLQEVPVKLAREIAVERGDSVRLQALSSVTASQDPSRRVTTKLPLRTISGEWLVLSKGKQVRLRPIDDDPRYHFVYEVDPDKEASGSHGDASSARKLDAITQFRQQLERERLQEAAQGR